MLIDGLLDRCDGNRLIDGLADRCEGGVCDKSVVTPNRTPGLTILRFGFRFVRFAAKLLVVVVVANLLADVATGDLVVDGVTEGDDSDLVVDGLTDDVTGRLLITFLVSGVMGDAGSFCSCETAILDGVIDNASLLLELRLIAGLGNGIALRRTGVTTSFD